MTVGKRILEVLEKKNIKIIDFANAVNVFEENIAEWKYGNYDPTLVQLAKISNYLNVTTDYLIKGEYSQEVCYVCMRCNKKKKIKRSPFESNADES